MIKAAILAAAALVAVPSTAATYDAFSSFTGAQGAGHFFWGTLNGSTNPNFTSSSSCVIAGSTCLQAAAGTLPGVYKSTTPSFQFGTVDVPDDRLLVHPGPSTGLYGLFATPTAGAYTARFAFNIVDRFPTGVVVSPFLIIPSVFSGGDGPYALGAVTPSRNLIYTFGALPAGAYIGFTLTNGGNYFNDSVGLKFSVSNGIVPEPATWAMLIIGFGLTGAALRRRNAAAAAA